MNFAEPRWFWLLASILVLIVFYLRRGSKREFEVSSLFLWKKLQASSSAIQRKRFQPLPPSFYFWSLSILFFSGALASPSWDAPSYPEIVLLVDNSARMSTVTKSGKTRFELAKEEATRVLRKAGADARVTLEVFPGGPEGKRGLASDILPELRSLTETEASASLEMEVAKRLALISSSQVASFLFSDRVPKNAPGFLNCFAVGDASDNVGFIHCRVQKENSEDLSILAQLQNFSASSRPFSISAISEEKLLQKQASSLAPGEVKEFIFTFSKTQPLSTVELRLDPGDELAADDRLYFSTNESTVTVLAPVDLPQSLRRVFDAIPGVVLKERDFAGEASETTTLPRILIDAKGPKFKPSGMRVSASSNLGKLLDFQGIEIVEAYALPNAGESVLLTGQDESKQDFPLLLQSQNRIRLRFNLEKSSWPLHPSFPVFWAAWVEELRGQNLGLGYVSTGRKTFLRTGFYKDASGATRAANLLNPEQSDNRGERRSLKEPLFSRSQQSRPFSLVIHLVILAVCAFLFAWILEHQGK